MKSRILSVIIAVFCLCFASMPAKAEDTADVALYADVAQNLQTLEGTSLMTVRKINNLLLLYIK